MASHLAHNQEIAGSNPAPATKMSYFGAGEMASHPDHNREDCRFESCPRKKFSTKLRREVDWCLRSSHKRSLVGSIPTPAT